MKKKTNTDREKAQENNQRLVSLGVSGTKRYGGYIYDEFLTELQGQKGAKVYREMIRNEAVLSASFSVFESLLNQTPWYIEAAADTPQATEVKDFFESVFQDLRGGMKGVISSALTAGVYGHVELEKVFKIRRGPEYPQPFHSRYRDSRWGVQELGHRKQTSIEEWVYADDTGDELIGLVQVADGDNKRRVIPIEKCVHIRFKRDAENPEGLSLLRGAYVSYYYAKNMRHVEAVGIERYMVGIPVAWVPVEVMNAEAGSNAAATRDQFKSLVRNIRKDEQSGVVMPAKTDADGRPTGYDLSLLTGGGDKPGDVDPVIKRYESRMAMALLTEVMLLGSDAMGSYALSKDKTETLVIGLTTMLETIFQALEEQLFPELMVLNGWPVELTPSIRHGFVKAPNIADLASYITSVTSSGLVAAGEKAEEWAREQVGMPLEDASVFTPSLPDSIDTGDSVVDDVDVQATALNGAQVTSLVGIVTSIANREIPRDAGVQMVQTSFNVTRDIAERLVGESGRTFFTQSDGEGNEGNNQSA